MARIEPVPVPTDKKKPAPAKGFRVCKLARMASARLAKVNTHAWNKQAARAAANPETAEVCFRLTVGKMAKMLKLGRDHVHRTEVKALDKIETILPQSDS
jgi:hypothetical protein